MMMRPGVKWPRERPGEELGGKNLIWARTHRRPLPWYTNPSIAIIRVSRPASIYCFPNEIPVLRVSTTFTECYAYFGPTAGLFSRVLTRFPDLFVVLVPLLSSFFYFFLFTSDRCTSIRPSLRFLVCCFRMQLVTSLYLSRASSVCTETWLDHAIRALR